VAGATAVVGVTEGGGDEDGVGDHEGGVGGDKDGGDKDGVGGREGSVEDVDVARVIYSHDASATGRDPV
jgi:hypothetical protein